MISTHYHLPFQFNYCERVFSCGGEVQLVMRVENPNHMQPLQRIVQSFSSLAETGAFSGYQIPPWESTMKLGQMVSTSGNELRFYMENCFLADEALIVLAHMLLTAHDSTPIEYIKIQSSLQRDQKILKLTSEDKTTYPRAYPHLPFVLSDHEPEGGGYSFLIDLEKPLEQKFEICLNKALGAWVDTVLNGGYVAFPMDPGRCYVEPDEKEVTAYENKVEWAIFKLQADQASLDGLINLFIAFHTRCQKIMHIDIS